MKFTRRPLNPVLARELRVRMRGRQAVVVLTLYLSILSLVVFLTYQNQTDKTAFSSGNTLSSAAGRDVFQVLLIVVLGLVCFIVPGLTGGAITGERERQTLVPLQVTLMRPLSILLGKLGASVAFTVLLIVATLPLVGVAYVLGGVAAGDVLIGTAIIVFMAIVMTTFSLGWSTVFRSSQLANITSYATVVFLVMGTPLIYTGYGIATNGASGADEHTSKAIMMLNPFVVTADVVGGPREGGDGSGGPLADLRAFVHPDLAYASLVQRVSGGRHLQTIPKPHRPYEGFPFWLRSVIWLTGLGAITMAVSARRLRTPARRER